MALANLDHPTHHAHSVSARWPSYVPPTDRTFPPGGPPTFDRGTDRARILTPKMVSSGARSVPLRHCLWTLLSKLAPGSANPVLQRCKCMLASERDPPRQSPLSLALYLQPPCFSRLRSGAGTPGRVPEAVHMSRGPRPCASHGNTAPRRTSNPCTFSRLLGPTWSRSARRIQPRRSLRQPAWRYSPPTAEAGPRSPRRFLVGEHINAPGGPGTDYRRVVLGPRPRIPAGPRSLPPGPGEECGRDTAATVTD